MSSIRIIADSTIDLDPSLFREFRLTKLPLTIIIGEKSYLDGEEIQVADVYNVMRKGIVPKTSQIPYERVYDLFKTCFESGEDFIYIAFSSEMSGCYSLAHVVADELSANYPGRKFAVLDSKGGSGATGLVVLQALRMVRDGLPFETVKSEIQFMAEHVEHVFSVDDLAWLAKGGRIPKVVGYVGSKLNFHPLLDIVNGRITFRQMIRGKKKAIQSVATEIIRRAEKFPEQLIAIAHGDDLVAAKTLESLIRESLPDCGTTICHIGGVIGVHVGLKCVGAFCLNKRPANYTFV